MNRLITGGYFRAAMLFCMVIWMCHTFVKIHGIYKRKGEPKGKL